MSWPAISGSPRQRQCSARWIGQRPSPSWRPCAPRTRNQINSALLGAYGVVTADEKVVDVAPNLSRHFQSLKAGLTLAPPTKASLRDALDQVLDQALRHTYPGAPDLGTEVKPGEVRKVAELCTDAVVEPDGRLVVKEPGDRRLLARIANPLQLGIQSEQAFKLATAADRWDNIFTKAINQDRQNGADIQTVGLLREAIDMPSPMGLTSQLENLIILVWAQATNHTFRLHGGPVTPTVDRLDDAWEVVPQALPSAEVWQKAHERLASIFGITLATKQRSGFAVERAGIELGRDGRRAPGGRRRIGGSGRFHRRPHRDRPAPLPSFGLRPCRPGVVGQPGGRTGRPHARRGFGRVSDPHVGARVGQVHLERTDDRR